jgi:hypothetical protein
MSKKRKKKERERKFIHIFVYLVFQCVAQNIKRMIKDLYFIFSSL